MKNEERCIVDTKTGNEVVLVNMNGVRFWFGVGEEPSKYYQKYLYPTLPKKENGNVDFDKIYV